MKYAHGDKTPCEYSRDGNVDISVFCFFFHNYIIAHPGGVRTSAGRLFSCDSRSVLGVCERQLRPLGDCLDKVVVRAEFLAHEVTGL